MEAHWDEVLALLEAHPRSDEWMAVLDSLDAPTTPAEIAAERVSEN